MATSPPRLSPPSPASRLSQWHASFPIGPPQAPPTAAQPLGLASFRPSCSGPAPRPERARPAFPPPPQRPARRSLASAGWGAGPRGPEQDGRHLARAGIASRCCGLECARVGGVSVQLPRVAAAQPDPSPATSLSPAGVRPHALLRARSGLPAGSRRCPGDDERRINGAQGRQRRLPAALPAGSHRHRAAAARCAAPGVGARPGVGPGTSFHPRPPRLGRAPARPGRGASRPLPGHKLECPWVRSLEVSPSHPRLSSTACSGSRWPGASAGLSGGRGAESSLGRHLVSQLSAQPWLCARVSVLDSGGWCLVAS